MVLEEAKILGKSIIITDTAAREAVEKYNKSIILENNEEKIYEGLKQVIQNHNKNKIQESDEQYDNTKIIEKIEQLLNE